MYPSATLSQLKGTPAENEKPLGKLKRSPVSLLPPAVLTPREKRLRRDALEVVNKMREGNLQLSVIVRKLKKNRKLVLRHAGTALKKRKRDYVVKQSDEIPRSMIIITSGEEVAIVVDSQMATIVGKYHNARKKFLNEGDNTALIEFEGAMVTDIDGNDFVLDTNTENLLAIEERREEPEFYEIYAE